MKLESATRNAGADAIVDLIDDGATDGYIILQDSSENQVAKVTLGNPAFGDASAGVATANSISSHTIDTSGTDNAGTVATGTDPYGAILYDGDDTKLASLTVTSSGGGGDVELSGLTYRNGDTVSISSFTITVPQGV